MKVFFVDTNLFLQCQDLISLPWDELSEGEDILLVVSRPVQEEVDRLKSDGQQRRSKKARKTTSLFKEIIRDGGERKLHFNKGTTLKITFSPILAPGTTASELLDLSNPDDAIINEALVYKEQHPEQKVYMLTHDTNPMLTARQVNLEVMEIPDEWLGDPEPDARDKRIGALEQKIAKLEKHIPEILVDIRDNSGLSMQNVEHNVILYPELSEAAMTKLLEKIKIKHPIETNFGEDEPPYSTQPTALFTARNSEYQKPDPEKIKFYKDKLYPEWIDQVREVIKQTRSNLEALSRKLLLELTISNIGTLPAENLIVEIEVLGNFYMFEPDKEKAANQNQFLIPIPPIPPKGHWKKIDHFDALLQSTLAKFNLNSAYNSLSPLGPIHIPKERDKYGFYWRSGQHGGSVKKWEFECGEFRHRIEGELFTVGVNVPPNTNNGAIRCRVTAKNLPEPIIVTLSIEISYEEADSEEIICELIDNNEENEK